MQQLIYTLLHYLNNVINKDTNYHIACKVLEHIYELEHYSLEKMASLCFVSPATINRFCKQIGYSNYSTLRHISSIREEKYLDEHVLEEEAMESYRQAIYDSLQTIHDLDLHLLDQALMSIHSSKRCIGLGYGSYQHYILDLQKKLFSCGKYMEIYIDMIRQMEEIESLTKDDVVLITSLQGKYLFNEKFLRYEKIKRCGCKTILVTQMEDPKVLEKFDHVLFCGKKEYGDANKYALIRLYDLIAQRYRLLYHPMIKE